MTRFNMLKNLIIVFFVSLIFSAASCRKTDVSSLGNNITCYAASYSKGVYKSENGGISWYPMISDQDDICLYSKRLFLSLDGKKLYVTTTGNGLFYIDMINDTLNRVSGLKDEIIKSVIFADTSNGQSKSFEILACEQGKGIVKSSEGMDNWVEFNHGLTYRDVNFLYKNSGNVLAATVNGIFKLNEAYKAWQDSSEGIKNKNIISIISDTQGSTIYAGAGVYQGVKGRFDNIPCLYKSMDKGRTWVVSDDGLPDGTLVFSIAVNSAKPERIYAGTNQGIYRSTDGGGKWSKTDSGLPDKFLALDIKIVEASGNENLVFAAGANGIFMALDDKSQEWISRSYGLDRTYISSLLFITEEEN